MTTFLIIGVIIAIALALFVLGKKPYRKRGAIGGIVRAVETNAKDAIKEVSDSIRTAENVKKDLLQMLDKTEEKLRTATETRISELVKAQDIQQNLEKSAEIRVKNLLEMAKSETREELRKEFARNIVESRRIKERASAQKDSLNILLIKTENEFSGISLTIQQKRAEIMSSTIAPDVVMSDVFDLESELHDKIVDIQSRNKVNALTGKSVESSQRVDVVTDEEIAAVLNEIAQE